MIRAPRWFKGKTYRTYTLEHRVVAEKALNKNNKPYTNNWQALPKDSVVHHVNGNTEDNKGYNLIICEDKRYHDLIHSRTPDSKWCPAPFFN